MPLMDMRHVLDALGALLGRDDNFFQNSLGHRTRTIASENEGSCEWFDFIHALLQTMR